MADIFSYFDNATIAVGIEGIIARAISGPGKPNFQLSMPDQYRVTATNLIEWWPVAIRGHLITDEILVVLQARSCYLR